MSYKQLLIPFIVVQMYLVSVNAQDSILADVAAIKPMVSTKEDVIKKFSQAESEGNSLWIYLPDKSIEFFLSNGECREDWIAPAGKVVTISVFFRGGKPISDLTRKVKLKKLRKEYTLDGDRLYYDDDLGIRYGVVAQGQLWSSLTYYPSKKYSHHKC